MPRKFTTSAPDWKDPIRSLSVQQLTIKTITPMFGGGAVEREVGESPIRASSIRGHLRFWWRATTRLRYSSAEELYQIERNIWGDVENPSPVTLQVEVTKPGEDVSPDVYRGNARLGPKAGYFLYPFAGSQNQVEASGRKNVEFVLRVTYQSEFPSEPEVRRAIRAWLTVGGIGARTRRGCGAIVCDDNSWLPQSINDTNYFQSIMPQQESHNHFSSLSGGWVCVGPLVSNSEEAWMNLGSFWSRFRKGHFTGKRPGYKPMDGCEWSDHRTLKNGVQGSIALAKPYLGLPIIYQKFDQAFEGSLTSETTDRMSSPIILRPIKFADGTIRPMIVFLPGRNPTAIRIDGQKVDLEVPVTDPVLNSLRATHPIDAVRMAAIREGFIEVKW